MALIQQTSRSTGGTGTGDVTGPASSTDNAIARYDGTTGKIIQNSKAILQDSGSIEASSFVGNKEITEAIVIPVKNYMIASGLTITLTGSITISSDSDLLLI